MNLCVYVFILFAIVNFVNKFDEIYQNVSNFSFIDFDDCSFVCALRRLNRASFVANSPAFYLVM
jgi:hypothetical protein